MPKEGFGLYSKSPPILLPSRLVPTWRGSYLPLEPGLPFSKVELQDPDDFDIANPTTDHERVWAALESTGAVLPIQHFNVGSSAALVFATDIDYVTWWDQQKMLVNGFEYPNKEKLSRVDWKYSVTWTPSEPSHVLMCSSDHGCDPDKGLSFEVEFEAAEYCVQYGQYGWDDDDLIANLFRFVRTRAA